MRLFTSTSAAVLAIAALTCSAPAFAQQPKHAPAKPAPAPAPSTPPPPPASEALQNARAHFAAGVNLLRDPAKPRYEEAYREFKVAYSLSPAAQILGNLGLCAMMLERDAEAIDAYENYIKGMLEISPSEKEQIDKDLQTLKLGMARVTFTSNVPDVTIIDKRIPTQGEPINNVYGPMMATMPFPVGLRQGHHFITARAAGKQELTWEVDAVAGDLGVHPFEFVDTAPVAPIGPIQPGQPGYVPPPPPDRPIPTSFWIGASATGVLGIASAVTGILALNTQSAFKNANDGPTPERADELRTRAQAFNVTTDVLLIGTVVAAAFTGYVFFTRPEKRGSVAEAFLKGVGGAVAPHGAFVR